MPDTREKEYYCIEKENVGILELKIRRLTGARARNYCVNPCEYETSFHKIIDILASDLLVDHSEILNNFQ